MSKKMTIGSLNNRISNQINQSYRLSKPVTFSPINVSLQSYSQDNYQSQKASNNGFHSPKMSLSGGFGDDAQTTVITLAAGSGLVFGGVGAAIASAKGANMLLGGALGATVGIASLIGLTYLSFYIGNKP